MKKLIFLAFTLSLLTSCGNIEKLAQSSLYPAEQVNKAYPPIPKGKAPWQEHDLNGTYTYSGIDPSSDTIVVYLGGNGESLSSSLELFDLFFDLGISFISIDFPSYGHSTGFPEEKTLREAAQKAILYIKERYPNKKIILWGRSLGAAVALQAYSEKVDKVILISPFTNFKEAAIALSWLGRMVPKSFIEKNTYDSREKIKLVKVPILLIHGSLDDLVPYKMGVELSLTNSLVTFLPIIGASHNDVYGRQELWQAVKLFIEE